MAKLTIRNLTNSPFDLEGGVRLPAMGSVSADFTDHYAALLRISPGVEVADATEMASPPPAPEKPFVSKRRGRKG